jgi:hypothetical protein
LRYGFHDRCSVSTENNRNFIRFRPVKLRESRAGIFTGMLNAS